jgi:lipid-A-disaccharide synthase
MPPSIFISAGEASGEHYGALLIASLRQRLGPKLGPKGESTEFIGMGGPRMAAAGQQQVVRAEQMAHMGITEVIRHMPGIYAGYRKLRDAIRQRRPSVAVLIDFPDVHLKLAKELHALGIPVIYFVSPQLWAWKKRRIERVRKYVTRMLVIFPFEEPFYRQRGIQAQFVGHPLAELPLPTVSRADFAAHNHLHPSRNWIALLPGSRIREIRHNLPEMLAAAWLLALPEPSGAHPTPTYDFVVPLAPTLTGEQRAEAYQLTEKCADGLPVHFVDDARAVLHHARASVVASGTATVEAALIGNPFIVVYRVSPVTWAVAKRFVDVPHVAMANLIAGKRVVPELIQHDFTAANIVQHLAPLLPDGPPRQSMIQELAGIRTALAAGPTGAEQNNKEAGVMERVADVVLEYLPGAS